MKFLKYKVLRAFNALERDFWEGDIMYLSAERNEEGYYVIKSKEKKLEKPLLDSAYRIIIASIEEV